MLSDGPRCLARTKRTSQPCQAKAMANGRCRLHGGKSLRGLASPRWTSGRHSQALPAGLQDAYERALADPDLLALRSELALVDVRIDDLLQGLGRGESTDLWERLGAALEPLETAQREGDAATACAALGELLDVVHEGTAVGATWAAIFDALERRRRLAETERRRVEALQATLTAEEALALIGAVAASVKAHVTDRAALQAVSNDVERLLHAWGEGRRDAG
jgi:hypothetical protein